MTEIKNSLREKLEKVVINFDSPFYALEDKRLIADVLRAALDEIFTSPTEEERARNADLGLIISSALDDAINALAEIQIKESLNGDKTAPPPSLDALVALLRTLSENCTIANRLTSDPAQPSLSKTDLPTLLADVVKTYEQLKGETYNPPKT